VDGGSPQTAEAWAELVRRDPASLHTWARLLPLGARIDLRGADLRGVELRDALPRRLDLTGADLRDAHLSVPLLSRSRLQHARLAGVTLDGTAEVVVALQALWSGAEAIARWRASEPAVILFDVDLTGADLRGADLSGLAFSGAWLDEADLRGAELTGVNLTGASLRGVLAGGVRLSDTRMVRADLAGADLSGAHLRCLTAHRACFDRAVLRGSVWEQVEADRMSAASADLRDVAMVSCGMGAANFRGADLVHLVAKRCHLDGADLRDSDLSFARFVECGLARLQLEGARTHEVEGLPPGRAGHRAA
jgi:uncharacterized protein YjbI with pentapeptide repeats